MEEKRTNGVNLEAGIWVLLHRYESEGWLWMTVLRCKKGARRRKEGKREKKKEWVLGLWKTGKKKAVSVKEGKREMDNGEKKKEKEIQKIP